LQTLTPERVAGEILGHLNRLADPAAARSSQRFFKTPVPALGVRAPKLHKLARGCWAVVREAWDWKQAAQLAELLLERPHVESKIIGILILQRFSEGFPFRMVARAKGWLEECCDNWAVVDTLAPGILSPLVDRYPRTIPTLTGWTGSPDLWVRRAAVVAMIPHARRGRHLRPSYTLAERLLSDGEDLMHKAVGWLLREAGTTDAHRLKGFLLAHGPRVPRTTVRYAIEKLMPSERARLLQATRG
jgi:3-methyladenine DNA glycosylase AlkD